MLALLVVPERNTEVLSAFPERTTTPPPPLSRSATLAAPFAPARAGVPSVSSPHLLPFGKEALNSTSGSALLQTPTEMLVRTFHKNRPLWQRLQHAPPRPHPPRQNTDFWLLFGLRPHKNQKSVPAPRTKFNSPGAVLPGVGVAGGACICSQPNGTHAPPRPNRQTCHGCAPRPPNPQLKPPSVGKNPLPPTAQPCKLPAVKAPSQGPPVETPNGRRAVFLRPRPLARAPPLKTPLDLLAENRYFCRRIPDVLCRMSYV